MHLFTRFVVLMLLFGILPNESKVGIGKSTTYGHLFIMYEIQIALSDGKVLRMVMYVISRRYRLQESRIRCKHCCLLVARKQTCLQERDDTLGIWWSLCMARGIAAILGWAFIVVTPHVDLLTTHVEDTVGTLL